MSGLTRTILKLQLMHSRSRDEQQVESQASSSQAGVTLLEALVAIILITIIITVITPPIFMAVGTRVRHRRTEQAMQIAQDEIERVRSLMLTDLPYDDIDDALPAADTTVGKDDVSNVAAPTALCNKPAPCDGALQLAQTIDDGLFLQSFREPGAQVVLPDGQVEVLAFRMGVRVYGTDALDDNGAVNNDLRTDAAPLSFTSGSGYLSEARPLVTMYTEMVRGTQGGGLSAIQDW